MKKCFLLIFTVLFTAVALAQQPVAQLQMEYLLQHQYDKTTKYEGITLENLNYIGSPYTNDNFVAGDIYHDNKLVVTNVPVRYNALVDEMEFKVDFETPDSESKALIKSPEVHLKIWDKTFVFAAYQGGVEKGGYFEIVLKETQGVDLFKKYTKKYTPEKKASNSLSRDIPAKFSDNVIYYLVLHNGRFVELPSRARRFSKAFPGKENEIKNFIKDEDLDIKNESDLIKIVKHYNAL